MLIDKGITSGEVVTIKLTTGEEIIARLVEENGLHTKISKPLVLSMTSQGIGMMPFLFTVSPEKDIRLNNGTIAVIMPTDKQFADQYLSSTTGIKLT